MCGTYCMDITMNERIRELSEKAESYADANFKGEPTWSEAFEAKFAELIIKECALVGRRHILERHGMTTDYDGKVLVEDAIKNHFKEQ